MDIKRILESNLVVIPQLEEIAKILNESASLGDDRTARMLLSMVLCYPLGLLTSYFPSSSLRHLWSLLVGVVLVQFVFGVGWVHLLIPSAGVYAILALCRATGLAKQYRHWIASLFSFSYLVHRHLSRTSVKSNNIDESTLVMVLIIKLYTLCFNLYDAETYPSERAALDGKIKREEDPQKRSKLTRELDALEKKKDRSVKDLPNPLEFLAYVFNFPTVFCGPAFEFGEYKAAQDQISDEGNYLPTRFIPGLWKLLQGIVWFALTAVLQAYYPTTEIYPLSRPDSGASRLDLFRYIFLAIWFSRFKYYAVWKLSDGAAVLAGFGRRKSTHFSKKPNPAYTDLKIFTGSEAQTPTSGSATMDTLGLGIKGSSDWEGASNCNALAVETRNSIAEQIENWNIHTQSWLKYYVFFRLPQGYNRAITFLASAFWHGFFPGYYVAFFTVLLFQDSARHFVAAIDPTGLFTHQGLLGPRDEKSKAFTWPILVRSVTWFLQWVLITSAMTYAGASFVIVGEDDRFPGLTIWERISSIYGRLYWAGHVLAMLCLAMGLLFAPREPKRRESTQAPVKTTTAKGASASVEEKK